MKSKSQIVDEAVELITKEFVDKGKLIGAGWAAFRLQAIPPVAGAVQIEQMYLAYFAGSQHLFASIMTMLDPGEEETVSDLRRMALIEAELGEFSKVLEAVLAKAKASTQ